MQFPAWRNNLFFLIFQIISSFAVCQDKSDSLKRVIYSSALYKERINACLQYGEKYALKNFDETLEIEEEGILLAKKNHDYINVGNLKRYIGTTCYFKGNYNTAASCFYESISLLENTGQNKNLALVYNELAKLYRKTRVLDRASVNYEKALNLFIQLKDSAGISMIENEWGVVYEYLNNYEEAIKKYTASYEIAKALKNEMGISYALSNLAGVYTLQKKYTEAEGILKQALELRHLNDSLALALIYADVGNNYYSQKKYASAILYLDSSNHIALDMKYPELQTTNYKILSSIYQTAGDYKQALTYLQMQTALHDSLLNKEKFKQIEELNTKYETLKKEKIIQQQKFEINKRNYWITGAAIFLILISVAGFSYYKRAQLKQKSKLQKFILQQQESSTKAILESEENERQRIAKDLHDGIGQMMSVSKMNLSALEGSLGFTSEKQRAAYKTIISLVDESCKEIRNVSHNMMPNALIKNNLSEALSTFSGQINHPGLNIKLYTEGLDKKMSNDTETVLYRIIQECVNNVIKHACATTLDISVIKDKEGISVTIEDNGKGFDYINENYKEGIGIKNIKSRVQYLKGAVEFISSYNAGTLVSLHIPIIL